MYNCPICKAGRAAGHLQSQGGTHAYSILYQCGSSTTYGYDSDECADITDNCSVVEDTFEKKDKWVWFRRKRVELGEGHIIQYTLFESKKNFGVILYHWKTIMQNRFHSHAFPAYAFLLSGSYTEEVIENGVIVQKEVNNRFKRRYIPQNYIHRILKAEPRTWTLVFTGKWSHYWYEYFPTLGFWRKYTWGRNKIRDYQGKETFDILKK